MCSRFSHRDYTRESIPPDALKIDIYDSGYVAKMWLYIFCGILDSMWQTTAYWMMGAMSNDPNKLAYFAGFCTCSVALGARCARLIHMLHRQVYPVRGCRRHLASRCCQNTVCLVRFCPC